MKKRNILAYLLCGLLIFEGAFSPAISAEAAGDAVVSEDVQFTEDADEAEDGETAEDAAADAAADETDTTVPEEGAEAPAADEEGSTLSYLMGNLQKYMPDGTGEEAGLDQARLSVTGVNPIMPAEGDVNTLVIFTEFADCKFAPEFKAAIKEQMFADATADSDKNPNYPIESLSAYYQRASYGKLNIKGEFFEYSSEHERSYYNNSMQNNDPLYQEALNSWAAQIISEKPEGSALSDSAYLDQYLAKFDADNDMKIDGCYLCVAGGHTGWASQWWAYRTGASRLSIGSYQLPSVIQMIDRLNQTSGKDNVQDYMIVFTHETGHQLGLDDYYSYESDLSKIDTFAMMSSNCGDQDGFAKMLLGWLPEESVQFAYEDEEITLRPFSETGDIAIILPKNELMAYGIYSQFIMAEYYKPSGNDVINAYNRRYRDPETGEILIRDEPTEGLRLYHVYARLTPDGTAFIASNTRDQIIPLINNYNCKNEDIYGFYHEGDSLTPLSDPSSDFYRDNSGRGYLAYTSMVNSGISVSDISLSTDGTLKFNVDMAEDISRPVAKEVTTGFSYEGTPYICVTFDQPVNINPEGGAFVCDMAAGTPLTDENWGNVISIRRDLQYDFSTKSNTYYFMLDDFRLSDGCLILPQGMVSSTNGVSADDMLIPMHFYPDTAKELGVSASAGLYAEAFELKFEGLSEGDTVYYTLDGSEPDAESSKYEGSVKIEESCILKAIAVNAGGMPVSKRLRVIYMIERIKPERETLTLSVGEEFFLKAELNSDIGDSIKYQSSDNTVVYASETGNLMARAKGEAVISMTGPAGSVAYCKVTVTDDSITALEAALKEKYGNAYTDKLKEISKALHGTMTLAEFYENGYLNKRWVAYIDSPSYTGSALKPEVTVYDGADVLQLKKDYKVGYKNNKNAGTANVKVTFKGKYKKEAAQNVSFEILPVNIYESMYVFSTAVAYNGKLQKPAPLMLWPETGAKQKITADEFEIRYYDEKERPIDGVKEEGLYYAEIVGKGKNFTGNIAVYLKVKEKDVVEKLKIKKKKKSFKYQGGPVMPQYGTDFTIKAPKGYSDITDGNGNLLASEVEVYYLNNNAPGKMAMIITATEENNYSGTQVVYFTIKK